MFWPAVLKDHGMFNLIEEVLQPHYFLSVRIGFRGVHTVLEVDALVATGVWLSNPQEFNTDFEMKALEIQSLPL